MSNVLPSLGDLVANAGASAPSFFTKESKVGDSVTGTIQQVVVRQARDYKTGKPRFWEGGDPTLQVYVEIQAEGLAKTDDNDDGIRGVFIKWWGVQRKALLDALNAAGQSDLSIGQTFTATFTGTEKSPGKGDDDTKLYSYTIS